MSHLQILGFSSDPTGLSWAMVLIPSHPLMSLSGDHVDYLDCGHVTYLPHSRCDHLEHKVKLCMCEYCYGRTSLKSPDGTQTLPSAMARSSREPATLVLCSGLFLSAVYPFADCFFQVWERACTLYLIARTRGCLHQEGSVIWYKVS